MYIQSRVDPFESVRVPSGQRPSRAGLRTAPTNPGPTGAFVVVEMVVLVVVAALAMVSIIVSSVEGVDRSATAPASQTERVAARDGGPSLRTSGSLRPVESRRVAADLAAR